VEFSQIYSRESQPRKRKIMVEASSNLLDSDSLDDFDKAKGTVEEGGKKLEIQYASANLSRLEAVVQMVDSDRSPPPGLDSAEEEKQQINGLLQPPFIRHQNTIGNRSD
jgi:hypothetical protein